MKICQVGIEHLVQIVEIDNRSNINAWSATNYKQSFSSSTTHAYGIFAQNILIGFCFFTLVIDQADILQITIDQAWQNQGYGNTLLKTVCQHLDQNNCRDIFLEVATNNMPALKLYQSCNFNIIGTRKDYYLINGKHIDAFVMTRSNLEYVC